MELERTADRRLDEFLRESNAIEGVYDDISFDKAKEAWEFLIVQPKLTIEVILETHKILMQGHNLHPSDIGNFRRCAVTIGGRYGLNAILIPEEMEKWIKSLKKKGTPKSIKDDHVRYEHIHPFVDGNGRTGRLFMNYQRMRAGLPILVIHEGEEQMEYYKWFKEQDENSNLRRNKTVH